MKIQDRIAIEEFEEQQRQMESTDEDRALEEWKALLKEDETLCRATIIKQVLLRFCNKTQRKIFLVYADKQSYSAAAKALKISEEKVYSVAERVRKRVFWALSFVNKSVML